MTIAATICTEAAAIERAAMKPPREMRRQNHRHCIYCTIVVGEAVPVKEGPEWEPFSETPSGPVCDRCKADPLAKERVEHGETQSERRKTHNKQCRLADSRTLNKEERVARDAVVARLHGEGKCRAEIGERVGLTVSGVGNALLAIRRRRDAEILRLVDLGWSWQRIANKIGLSPSMIGKVVKRNRVQT